MSLVPPRCAAAAPLPMTAPCRVRTCSNGVTGPERRALVRALRGTGDRPIDTAAAAPLLPSLAGCRTAFDAHAIGRGRGLRPPRGPSLQVGPGPPNSPARSDGPGLVALHAPTGPGPAWPTWCPRRRSCAVGGVLPLRRAAFFHSYTRILTVRQIPRTILPNREGYRLATHAGSLVEYNSSVLHITGRE